MPEVIMPKMGDAMEEGTLLSWLKQDGETVSAGDLIAEIETDKSNVEIEAEESGVLHIQAQPGQTVPVGQTIAVIGDAPVQSAAQSQPVSSASQPAAAPAAPKSVPASASLVSGNGKASANGQERVKASPFARSIARERGVDIAHITGTGPLGRILAADVETFLQSAQSASPTVAKSSLPSAHPTAENPQQRSQSTPVPSTTPIELSAIRKVIAKRMVESKTTLPHFYITSEVDMAEAIALRDKLNSYDETLSKISFNDMVVKAAAKALVKVPAVNAVYKDDKIYPGNGVHVGIAVALDDGLIVPVLRDADKVSLRVLSQTGKDLIKKARDKKLQPNEYSGGTFTVSNLGAFDVENFIAIIDPAQGAILAVSSIVKKPVVLEDGETIAVRPRMNLTFSGDHRVMDGATGAKFLQEVKRFLQNPLSLME